MGEKRHNWWACVLAALGGCAELGEAPDLPDTAVLAADEHVVEPDPPPCEDGDVQRLTADGTCFFLVRAPATFQQARDACLALSADLAPIATAEDEETVYLLAVGETVDPDVYFGATDVATEGVFRSMDGTVMSYSNFRAGEPNNGNGAEDCLVMETDTATHTWDDRSCGTVHPFVCARPR